MPQSFLPTAVILTKASGARVLNMLPFAMQRREARTGDAVHWRRHGCGDVRQAHVTSD
ncbi:hypothetical protein [Sabulicella rubraurantiaca]